MASEKQYRNTLREAENKMEGEGCNVRGGPTVIDYEIGACAGAGAVIHKSKR